MDDDILKMVLESELAQLNQNRKGLSQNLRRKRNQIALHQINLTIKPTIARGWRIFNIVSFSSRV